MPPIQLFSLVDPYVFMQDTQFQDVKRMLYNSELPILKEMFPEVSFNKVSQPRGTHLILNVYVHVGVQEDIAFKFDLVIKLK